LVGAGAYFGALRRATPAPPSDSTEAAFETDSDPADGELADTEFDENETGLHAAANAFVEPYFPFLDDESTEGSVSVGDTTHGYVVNAKPLTESEAVGILPKQRERDLAYGTSELIGLVEYAGAELFARTNTRLWVGNIGRRGGGNIPWSVSHNAGRDVDVAIAYLDRAGHAVDPPDLIALDATGVSKTREYRFDAARSWLIVKSLLRYEGAQIQYVFLSVPLKERLLAQARRLREPASLIARADNVVKQPAGGQPHNDHMHVRIFCGARDVEGGCFDFGLVHSWTNLHQDARARRIRLALDRLDDERPDQRRRALERLTVLDDRADVAAAARSLGDADTTVRQAAATAVGALGSPPDVAALVERFVREDDTAVRISIVRAAARIGGAAAGRFLADVIGSEPVPPSTPQAVASLDEPVCGAAKTIELFSPAFSPVCIAPAGHAEPFGEGPAFAAPSVADTSIFPGVVGDGPAAQAALPERVAFRLAAIEAAGASDRLEPVPGLLDLLAHPDHRVRGAAARSLSLITNRSFGAAWDDDATAATERLDSIESWRRWARQLKNVSRDAWLAAGFLAAGYRVPRFDRPSVWELVRALSRGGHLAYNAHRALSRIADNAPVDVAWSDPDVCHYWLGWFGTRRRRFDLEPAPPKTLRSCP
jgi:penicillin-insensitive murein endopeptidase